MIRSKSIGGIQVSGKSKPKTAVKLPSVAFGQAMNICRFPEDNKNSHLQTNRTSKVPSTNKYLPSISKKPNTTETVNIFNLASTRGNAQRNAFEVKPSQKYTTIKKSNPFELDAKHKT